MFTGGFDPGPVAARQAAQLMIGVFDHVDPVNNFLEAKR
jgi:hypothetical protein